MSVISHNHWLNTLDVNHRVFKSGYGEVRSLTRMSDILQSDVSGHVNFRIANIDSIILWQDQNLEILKLLWS